MDKIVPYLISFVLFCLSCFLYLEKKECQNKLNQKYKTLSLSIDKEFDFHKQIEKCKATFKDEREAAFIEEAIKYGIILQINHRIPLSVTLGISSYESNFGKSFLSKSYNNYFGIKGLNYSGKVVWMETADFNKTVVHNQPFRVYKDKMQGFLGFAHFLKRNRRYKKCFNYTDNYFSFLKTLQKAGYCPDNDYVKNVDKIIKEHNFIKVEKFIRENS